MPVLEAVSPHAKSLSGSIVRSSNRDNMNSILEHYLPFEG